jgi:ABC-type amino acid transport substrate-binding protein
MSLIRLPCAVLVALLALAPAASAATYTVGVEAIDHYPLYAARQGEYIGFARDVLDAFARDSGHTLVYKPMPIKRLHTAFLIDQRLDLKFPDNSAWQAEARKALPIVYSTPVATSTGGMLVKKERKGQGLAKIRTVGTILGFTPPALTALPPGTVKVVENSSLDGLLQQVILGRLDAAFVSIDVTLPMLSAGGQTPRLVFDPGLPHDVTQLHLSTLKHPGVIAEFNNFLLREQRVINALRLRYQLTRPGSAGP